MRSSNFYHCKGGKEKIGDNQAAVPCPLDFSEEEYMYFNFWAIETLMNVRCTHPYTDSVYLEWGWGEQTCIGLCCFADRKGEKSSHTMFYACDDNSIRAGLFAGFI